MPEPQTQAHIYHRQLSPAERTSLSSVASQILPGSSVLDLGTGSGALGMFLCGELKCTVDGLTHNAQEADIAAPSYRRIMVADLDRCDLGLMFQMESYDYVVCADVLEHTKQPRKTLDAAMALLKPHGKLIISMPNASYCGLVAELMQGEFRYRNEGLLDSTHLRFFTRASLLRLMHEAGWTVDSIDVIERPLNESEFRIEFDQLPPAVTRYVLALPDALAYQMIVTATPSGRLPKAPASAHTPIKPQRVGAAHALFTAQLYWSLHGKFAEDQKVVVAGKIGESHQELVFRLPSGPTPVDISSLRLDPADRQGFLYLYSISLHRADGLAAWSWSYAADGAPALLKGPTHQVLYCPDGLPDDAALLALHGDDPWLELPIPASILSEAAGGQLLVELGWPMSADYLEIKKTVDRLVAEQTEPMTCTPALPVTNDARAIEHAAQLELKVRELESETLALKQCVERIERSFAMRFFRPLYMAKYWVMRGLNTILGKRDSVPEAVVDVIVPVYSGLNDTRRCIESLLSSKCKTLFRVIVINDASPEPALTHWLRQAADKESRIFLLENPENLGFVATVNRGMQQSVTHDVVLLNSDTEVANDWLDRLRSAAYSDARVASVTPFSNNATICSYPKFCEVNPPPEMGTAALDSLFAKCNPGQVVDVPTAVGFCMYIRRECLQGVGLFDVENFGKGYGEENDFCVRAASAGWRNLHALDVFVLHAGGVSFGESKKAREQAAMLTLKRLHPGYEPAVHAFLAMDPAKTARLRVMQCIEPAEQK